MGHRFSKNAANNLAGQTTSINKKGFNTTASTTNIIPIPNGGNQQQQQQQQFVGPTINLQIQENSSATYSGNNTTDSVGLNNHITTTAGILQQQQQKQQHQYNINNSVSSSLTSVNNLSFGRQIIIKIQLAKMENGNETSSSSPSLSTHQQKQQDTSFESSPADCNLNSTELSTTVTAAGTQFLNLTLNSSNTSNYNSSTSPISNTNTMGPPIRITPTTTTTPTSSSSSTSSISLSTPSTASLFRTAGSSLNKNNNYLNSSSGAGASGNGNNSVLLTSNLNERSERLNSLQFNDEIFEQNIGEIVEYCEVLENPHLQPQTPRSNCNSAQMLSINEETDNEPNVCCRRKSKSLTAGGGSSVSSSSNTGAKAKSRCRKCSCRDAFKRFLDPSLSRSTNKNCKLQKEQKHTKSQDRHSINNPILNNTNKSQQQQRNSLHSGRPPTTAAVSVSSHVSLWGSSCTSAANGSSDVLIPITTPTPSQFVVVQCAIVNPGTNATCNNLISIAAQDVSPSTSSNSPNESMVTVPLNNSTIPTTSTAVPTGPIVHSQVDFVHYLVPDLERITNSSFYWGKMDRYEAERLLEGKPEGTFLLRDSAQEEFLFSVTFRKYGRSLHARIEQSDHRFSFDCHDPCVFTAPTVTGLLEHYKGPSCVMFFEPMLTIPLHRKNCFALQTLCRAKIVSNTTYDGINELELPARLKSYLKEYHYKQKLRVISNEHTYTLHCK